MKKFELFLGCLGNGTTVCNKAVTENGDYKHIAHITDGGFIKWYVNPGQYVPGNDLLKIEHYANVQSEKWEKWFSNMSDIQKYEYLLNKAPLDFFMAVIGEKMEIFEKVQILKNEIFKRGLI